MAEGLQIRIAAEVEDAIRSLQRVQKELENTGKSASNSGKGFTNAEDKLKKLPQSANQASAAMINLNRVVQDSPYGFIGIANNLEQLFSSFQTLQANTKQSGGALKALASALSGPAGLALGFSVVTAAISFAQIGFSNWVRGSKNAAKATDEATKALERFNEVQRLVSQDQITVQGIAVGNASGEIAQVQALAKVVQDQTLGYQQRNNALLELQKINKNYFGDLTLEQASLGKLTSAVNAYSQALIQAEVVKIYKERVGQAVISLNDQIEAERKLQTQLTSAKIARDNAAESMNRLMVGEADAERQLAKFGKAEAEVVRIQKQLIDQGGKITQSQKSVSDLTKLLNSAIGISSQFKPLTATAAPIAKAQKIKVEDLFELDPLKLSEVTRGYIFEFRKYMNKAAKEKFTLDFNIDPTQNLSKVGKDVSNYFKNIWDFKGFKGLTGFQKDLADSAELIANTLSPSLDAMVMAISRGENAFKAFGEGVKAVLVQVIQKLVSTAILAALLSAIPGFGAATGAGTFGSIFGKLLGFKATGGPVSGGNPYLVGERGPELFVPSVSGGIVPNNQVGSFMGRNASQNGSGSILRGQDILLAYARTQRSQLRVNG